MNKTLAEIARQAWLECPLAEDYWEAAAQAVRDAVIEECAAFVESLGATTEIERRGLRLRGDEWNKGRQCGIDEATKSLRSLKSKGGGNDAD